MGRQQLTKSKGCVLVRNKNAPLCINETLRPEHIRISPDIFVHESAIKVADDHGVLQDQENFGYHQNFALPLAKGK